ncbi:MAG: 4-(cytidine 5'-diphospho)-2-C-methyl-D-erythritol kinase [Tannerella sp.]|jgi:4-diphosphocytidyl-2-C-methyl-D-erythritol kinase|nr:4-(cytidine 5'-diphospho)-2-C-methyl-D-erythritol kinase [Tannerella sp.]
MLLFPNAKINLGLHITAKRPDGYHDIETVFYPVPLCDALEAVKSETLSFSLSGLPLDATADDNLVMKAYRLMAARYDVEPLEIYLRKTIPSGAGLGGGSADAAFMLKLINELCSCGLSEMELETIAAEIGADCPFFIRNKPVVATGRGDVFEPVALSLKGYYLYIIKPPFTVSTREAYASVKPCKPSFSLASLTDIHIGEWRHCLVNDFEPSVFAKYPAIGEIKEQLYALGAEYAAMSGSGSSVFGVFKNTISSEIVFKHESTKFCIEIKS